MRLLLIGNYSLDHAGSMERYAEMLRRELTARGHLVSVQRPPAIFGRLHPRGSAGKWLGYLDKYLVFPLRLRRLTHGWDRVHICDHSNSIYLPHLPRSRRSITCHDVIAIDAASNAFPEAEVGRRISWTGRVQQRWIRRHLLQAERIVAVSHATASRLRAMGAAGEIRVIHNPLHRPFAPAAQEAVAAARQSAGLPDGARYLLHVGGNAWYKNRLGALRIFAALRALPGFGDLYLVMAGPTWTGSMRQQARDSGIDHAALEMFGVSDAGLQALYTGAEALLFPSLTEGFGWPLIEAQSCGTPVLTSDRAILHEIAGQGAIFLDPLSPELAASAIAAAWKDMDQMRLRGTENLQRFEPGALIDRYKAFLSSTTEPPPHTWRPESEVPSKIAVP